jgi:type VI secretion system secreted protein VgrG
MALLDVLLACEPLGPAVVLVLDGREAMHRLPIWRLRVRAEGAVDPAALVRAHATLSLVDPDEGSVRDIGLVVVRASASVARGREHIVELELSDPLWPLCQRAGYKLFLDKSSETIVKELIAAASPETKIVSRLSGGYVTWPQRVQYGEVEWSFIERILADDGIGYWVDTVDGKATIVLGDSFGSLSPIMKKEGDEDVPVIPYVGPDPTRSGVGRAFSQLSWEERVAHDKARVRDFDIAQPDKYIEGSAGEGTLEHFEYPARVPPSAAADRATRRLEQLRRDEVLADGVCDCVRLQVGRKLKLTLPGVPMAGSFGMFEQGGQEMAIAALHHRYERPSRNSPGVPYRSQVSMRPFKAAAGAERFLYRPAIIPPVRVDHTDSAITTGAGGEEIHVDEYGRVKLRWLWDRSGKKDDTSSYWARCLQAPISAPMFLPRVGWEVVVPYMDGIPDQPFVLGRVYNATAVVPYGQPARSATTSFQSWSSPGRAQAHEIRTSDDAGSEEYYVHASRDQTENVGNDATTEVGVDEENLVGESHTSGVTGDHTLTVGGPQELHVGKEAILNVKGSNTEIIGAAELINVTGNKAVLASSYYFELVGAAYGIQANQINYSSSPLHARVVAGNMGLAAGLGFTESVLGARVYSCRGSRNVTTKKAYSQSVTGGLRTNSGPVTENAGTDLGIQAWGGKISAGATTIQAGGKVSVTAKNMTINVGTLLANTLEIGGKLKTTGGMLEVKGDTKRVKGGKVG